jgi:hypothetical protein
MKRKYKNVKNRPLPIDGIGSVGGRAVFWVEDDQMSNRIRQLEKEGEIRLIEKTEIVVVPNVPEVPIQPEVIEEQPVSNTPEPIEEPIEDEVNPDENDSDASNDELEEEKDDNLLTNDEEMMESKEEEEADLDDSNTFSSIPKKKKRKKHKGKLSSNKA